MTGKAGPTYDLEAIKVRFSSTEALAVTKTATRSALELGFGRSDIVETIQTITRTHFYKSMPSNADGRIWQDVYHVPSSAGVLYVKFTSDVVTEFLLLSFKEK